MICFVRQLVRRYFRHQVGIQAAALTLYLLFMIFPVLIFLSALLGLLHLDVEGTLSALDTVIPREAVEIVGVYLRHVQSRPSRSLALFGLVFSVWFPTRAANALLRAVRTAYHLGPPKGAVRHACKSVFYTALLISTITITLGALSVTDRVLLWGTERLGLPAVIPRLWALLRFPAAGAAGFFALCALYVLAQDRRPGWREIFPGTAFALAGWLGISWGYSIYVENFADYSALYGSIGTVIVVLIWLNLSAVTLILGAEVNGMVSNRREREDTV